MLRTRQSITAAEMDIVAIPMQAQRATQAVLAHPSMALTTAQDRPLPAPAADRVHLRIQARRRGPVRLLDQVPPDRPLTIHLLRVPTLLRTQATAHRPDQATVHRLHPRLRRLPRRRIPAEVVRRDRELPWQARAGLRPARSIPIALFYTSLRAERSHSGAKTA